MSTADVSRGGVNTQDASGSARPVTWNGRRVAHGLVLGALSALVVIELVALMLLLYVEGPVGEATVAIGTLALAIATAGLAFATFALVRTTAVELDLLRQQTVAMTEQASVARDQLNELREALLPNSFPCCTGSCTRPAAARMPTSRRRPIRLGSCSC